MAEVATVVRSLHILAALLWAGGSIFYNAVIKNVARSEPAMERSIFARSVMGPYFGLTSLLTLVFGLWTYYAIGPDSYDATQNMVLGIGIATGGLAVLVGWGAHMPNMVKLQKLIKNKGDDAQIDKRLHREHLLDRISMVLTLTALAAMISFRWF